MKAMLAQLKLRPTNVGRTSVRPLLTPSFRPDTVRDWPVEAGALHGVVSSDFRARAPGCPRRPDIGAAGAAAPRSAAEILLGSALRARAAESASAAARSGNRRRAG